MYLEVIVFCGNRLIFVDERATQVAGFLNHERQLRRTAHHERIALCHTDEGGGVTTTTTTNANYPSSGTAAIGHPQRAPTAGAPIQRKATPVSSQEPWLGGQQPSDATLLSASLALGDASSTVSAVSVYFPRALHSIRIVLLGRYSNNVGIWYCDT
jgi:hypothetical protein